MFGRAVVGSVVAACVLSACEPPPKPLGECGGEFCTAEQRCDPDTLRCVTDTAPSVTLTPIAAVVSAASFVVNGTALDDVRVTRATWSFAGAAPQEFELGADGKFSVTVPAPLADEQAFTFEVKVTDGRAESSGAMEVRVDRVGPTVALVVPASGVAIGGASPQVSLRATDASGALGAASVDDKAVPSVVNAQAFSAPVTVPAGLSRQLFPVRVSVADEHGNVTIETFQVLGDSVAPVLAVTAPAADDVVVTSSTLRVEGTVVEPSAPVVSVSGLDAGAVTASVDGGLWFADLSIPEIEATQTLTVVATDTFGQASTASRRIRIDRVGPQLSLTAPAAGSLHRAAFTVSATTGADAVSVEARLGSGNSVALSGGPTSWSAQVPVPSLDYGSVELVVTARDAAGGPTVARVNLMVDSVAPVVTFTAPAAGRKFNIADFTTSSDVTVTFGVQDGDPQAAVTQINGSPGSAAQVVVTTAPTDNGRVVTTTVVAGDRAGNTTTATRTFSVDRVRPTVTAWTPAANTRNVDPQVTSISFSEPVFGPTTASDALTLTPAATGSWNAAHSTWTSATLQYYRVYDAALVNGALADDHGNAVAPSSRRFSTAAYAPSGDFLLRSAVTDFRAAADQDGLVTVAVKTSNGLTVEPLSPTMMSLGTPLSSTTGGVTVFAVNAWSLVDPTALTARAVVGMYRFLPCTTTPCFNDPFSARFENGTSTLTSNTGAFVLSQGPLTSEANRAESATINGTSYIRGTAAAITLPLAPQPIVAQSRSSWVGFLPEAGQLRRVRYACGRGFDGTTSCFPQEDPSIPASGTPSSVSVALTPDGSCLAMSWSDGNGRRLAFAPYNPFCIFPSADPRCNQSNPPAQAAASPGYTVGPWSGGGANGLLAAWQDGSVVRLAQSNSAACDSSSFTSVGVLQSLASTWQPVQVGQKPALIYRTTTNELRLFIP